MDLELERQKKLKLLDKSIHMMRETSSDYAQAYTEYRIAVAKELTKLRAEGVPVTIAYDIARGNPEIAKLKFKEIATEGIYKANQESINALKLEIKILENALNREYGTTGQQI